MKDYSVCVDFDGVLHNAPREYVGSVNGPPVQASIDWLNQIGRHFNIYILTCRGGSLEQQLLITEWLQACGVTVAFVVTNIKMPALIYVDDRAWRFTGDNLPSVQEIHNARPWNRLKDGQ